MLLTPLAAAEDLSNLSLVLVGHPLQLQVGRDLHRCLTSDYLDWWIGRLYAQLQVSTVHYIENEDEEKVQVDIDG